MKIRQISILIAMILIVASNSGVISIQATENGHQYFLAQSADLVASHKKAKTFTSMLHI